MAAARSRLDCTRTQGTQSTAYAFVRAWPSYLPSLPSTDGNVSFASADVQCPGRPTERRAAYLGWMIARVICSASSVVDGQSNVGLLIRSEMTPCKPDHKRSARRCGSDDTRALADTGLISRINAMERTRRGRPKSAIRGSLSLRTTRPSNRTL